MEHSSELYSWENAISDTTFDSVKWLPHFIKELSMTINHLPIREAPGLEGILSDYIKCAKDALLDPLYDQLC